VLVLALSMSLAEFLARFGEAAGPVAMEERFHREWGSEPLPVGEFPWKDPEKAARAARELFQAQGFGLAPLATGGDGGWLAGRAAVVDRVPLPIRYVPPRGPKARGRIARLQGREIVLGDELAPGARTRVPEPRIFVYRTNTGGMGLEGFLQIAAKMCGITCDATAVTASSQRSKVLTTSELRIEEEHLRDVVQAIVNLHGLAIVPRVGKPWEVHPFDKVALGPADYEAVAADAVAEAGKRYELLSTRLTLKHLSAADAVTALAELVRRRAPFGFARADGEALLIGDLGPQLVETVALVQALDQAHGR
jgi:hypothetical protein